jgi:hypothetical protein
VIDCAHILFGRGQSQRLFVGIENKTPIGMLNLLGSARSERQRLGCIEAPRVHEVSKQLYIRSHSTSFEKSRQDFNVRLSQTLIFTYSDWRFSS